MTRREHIVFAVVMTLFSLASSLHTKRWETKSPIEWDTATYYSYLPMGFFHQRHEVKVWNLEEDTRLLGYYTDSLPPKMTIGMAISWFPAFILAHTVAEPLGYKADGISEPYKFAIHFSLFLYLFWGWWALARVWTSFGFSTTVQISGAALLLFGSNLLYYTSDETALSHGLLFILISLLLFQSVRWWESERQRHIYAIAALLGFIVLIRPSNALFAALPFIVGLRYHKPKELFHRLPKWPLLLAIVIGALVLSPQLLFWKLIHGQWVIYSYGEEGFFWQNPQIINGLFSYRKGWLLYTPLGIFMLIGLGFLIRRHKHFGAAVSLFTLLFIYVAFSWWCWWYGGSFSQRIMIDLYPVLSIALLSLIAWAYARLSRAIPAVVIASLLVCYNALQTFQYRDVLIHHDSNSKCTYNLHFMQWKAPQQYWWHLMYHPDYDKAIKGKEAYPPKGGWDELCETTD